MLLQFLLLLMLLLLLLDNALVVNPDFMYATAVVKSKFGAQGQGYNMLAIIEDNKDE